MTEKRAIYKTNIGVVELIYIGRTLCSIGFTQEDRGVGERNEYTDCIYKQIEEYISGERKNFDVDVHLKGTIFQLSVWRELMNIPYGEVRTYGEIATAIGSPKAARAVGMACNKNKHVMIVPCHRVIGANGSLVGYAGGVEVKSRLLDIEQSILAKGF